MHINSNKYILCNIAKLEAYLTVKDNAHINITGLQETMMTMIDDVRQ